MQRIVLASASPRRAALLSQLNIPFTCVDSCINEKEIPAKSPSEFAVLAAKAKAKAVAKNNNNALVIGADTIVICQNKILGKPSSAQEAKTMLFMLSGVTHEVITGLSVIDALTCKEVSTYVSTKVWFKQLTEDEVEEYVRTGEPMDKAGAYAIQGLGAIFVTGIEGCYFNIVGLPLTCLYQILTSFGINILC